MAAPSLNLNLNLCLQAGILQPPSIPALPEALRVPKALQALAAEALPIPPMPVPPITPIPTVLQYHPNLKLKLSLNPRNAAARTPATTLHLHGNYNMLQFKQKTGPSKTILIVRHGATKMNNQTDMSEDRIRGWSDVPLSPEGIDEAHKSAADLLPFDLDIIVTSDLARAAQTAEIIGQTCHCPVFYNPLLRPWNLGHLQGATTKDALPTIQKFVCNFPDKSVPGGESFHSFTSRAFRGLQQTIQIAGPKNVCCVTHHRDERLFFAWRDEGFPPNHAIKISTFLQKGEAPGAVLPFEVPLNAFPNQTPGFSTTPGHTLSRTQTKVG